MIGHDLLHYRVLSELGAGGMGKVYLAEDTHLKRKVALKLLPAEMASDPEFLERFQREAETIAALNHPNIVTIHSIEESDEFHFLTTEVVEGRPLDRVIPSDGLELETFFKLAVPIADALAAAHEVGIVHRDLKPANVMVTEEGRVKLLDFGLAKLTDPTSQDGDPTDLLTGEGTVLGTVAYMSPEQLQGQKVDQRSDIFSLGILLYEMAAGCRPFQGDSSAAVLSSILRDEPAPLSTRRRGLPRHLERIVERCLEKPLTRRFQSVLEVRNELENLRREDESQQHAPARRVRPEPSKSIAVLPFANMSPDPDNEYFSDGVSEEIMGALGRVPDLRVAARSSCFALKGKQAEAGEIGAALGVGTVLEGSVRRSGDRLRISAQLTDTETGYQLWAERFDGTAGDIFALQDEIAEAIARRMELSLETGSGARTRRGTENLEAHDCYLRGRFRWEQRGRSLVRACEHFQRAVDLDPGYALAWAGLADAYSMLGFYGLSEPRDAMPKAELAARRALALDVGLAEAHANLGFKATTYDRDWDEGRAAFRRALEIDPDCVVAHSWFGVLDRALVRARFDEGLAAVDRARELDPLNANPLVSRLAILIAGRRFDQAEEEAREVIAEHPSNWLGWRYLGNALFFAGDYEAACEASQRAVEISGRFPWALADFGAVLARLGRVEEAESLQREVQAAGGANRSVVSWVPASLGRWDEALDLVEAGVASREPVAVSVRTWPGNDPLRDHPRFEALMEEMAFPAR